MQPAERVERLLSLDIMRGITVAGMILVNNPGSWGAVYAPLRHVSWNGLTPTDLVFPFFMFIMGVSMYMSLAKFDFKPSGGVVLKIFRRALVIFLVGIGINWFALLFSALCDGGGSGLTFFQRFAANLFPFEHIRIPGVMQRLAWSYLGAALISLWVKPKYYWHVIIAILLAYFVVLLAGDGFLRTETNVIGAVDRCLFGEQHILKAYSPEGQLFGFDPEALLSTIPCFAHVLIGMFVGYVIRTIKTNEERILRLFICGTVILFAGLLLDDGCPVNKKIWSSTYVLVSCGFAIQFLALLIYLVDVKQRKKWGRFFESFGVNPLFIYVLAAILSIIVDNIGISYAGKEMSLHTYVYSVLLASWINPYLASLVYSVLFVMLNWVVAWGLYRKRIFIKI